MSNLERGESRNPTFRITPGLVKDVVNHCLIMGAGEEDQANTAVIVSLSEGESGIASGK